MNKKNITDIISSYEKGQYEEIIKWENTAPSVVSQFVGVAMKPITWVVQKVIPTKAIQGALTASDWLAESLTDTKDILRDGNVSSIKELQHKDLELSDNLANEVHNWADGIATAEGGIAGFFGLPGMAFDIPALITMSLRVIHKIGLCYGYQCKTEADKRYVLAILSAAGANSVEEKAISVTTLQAMNTIIGKMTWKKMTEKAIENKLSLEAAIVGIRNLAKQLGINITKRKATQAIPVVGAGVAAAMNLAFINDVAWAARRAFQERWLIDNGKIVVSE